MKGSIILKSSSILVVVISLALVSNIAVRYKKKFKECKKSITEKTCLKSTGDISLENMILLNSLELATLEAGKEEMLKHKLMIVGITRDNAQALPSMTKHIEYVGGFFKDYRVVLFENDSKDGTKAVLNSWQNNNSKVKIISHDFNNIKRPSHKFMADARNYYLHAIENKEYKDFDIVMMIDMDMEKGIDIRGIEDSFSKIDKWDAVCSNGIRENSMEGRMYDMFAFRNEYFPWTPLEWPKACRQDNKNHLWSKICNNINQDWPEDDIYWKYIVPQGQKIYSINSSLIPVQSCFGGMAFYKLNFIQDCRYDSIDNDCEHIPFHNCLRTKHNGRMVMNPNQVIRYD